MVNMPPTRPDGDLYVAQIAQEGGAQITSIPRGWTELTNRSMGGNTRLATYWKIGSSEPATYTWGSDSGKKQIGAIHRLSGIDTSSPINAKSTQFISPLSFLSCRSLDLRFCGQPTISSYLTSVFLRDKKRQHVNSIIHRGRVVLKMTFLTFILHRVGLCKIRLPEATLFRSLFEQTPSLSFLDGLQLRRDHLIDLFPVGPSPNLWHHQPHHLA